MIATKLFVGRKMLRLRLNMYLYKELSIDICSNEIKAKFLHYSSLFAIVEESKQLLQRKIPNRSHILYNPFQRTK